MDTYEEEADSANITDPDMRAAFIACIKSVDEEFARIDEEEFNFDHVVVTPVFEILSVSISASNNDQGDERPSQVYGTIQVIDEQGALFSLYKRDENDTETVSNKGGLLTLTHPKERAISPLYQVEVKIDINDKAMKANIANGILSLDFRTIEDDDYDKVQTQYVDGLCGHAAVQYITYRHASIASVHVYLCKKSSSSDDDSNCTDADIYGKIVASYGTTSRVLFERTQDESVRMKYGNWMDLSRYALVVPVYSFLVIAVDLWNRDTQKQVCFKETFEHFDFGRHTEMIMLRVTWNPLCFRTPPERKLKNKGKPASNDNKKLIARNQNPSLSIGVDRDNTPLSEAMRNLSVKLEGCELLEVLSVSIISNSGEDFDLWGRIKVRHNSGYSIMFHKEKEDAVKLLSNQTAPITAPNRIFRSCVLKIKVNLKDAEDRKISVGIARWDARELFDNPRWFDKPLCSVIRGDIGYAAVHYAIFSNGIKATLKVLLDSRESNTDNRLQVYGSVFSEYSRYFRYVSPYEEKHYKNELFQRDAENQQMLSPDFEVPLSKYVFGVPLNSALIVDLHLMVNTTPNPGENSDDDNIEEGVETFRGRLYFNTPRDRYYEEVQRIRGNRDNEIVVFISWSVAYLD